MSIAELKLYFENFFANHKQVSSFYYGSLEDFISYSSKDYISVNCEYISSNCDNKFIFYTYNISIADLSILEVPETVNSALNNSVNIAKDFLAYLRDSNIDFSNVNIQPFTESTGDIAAGVVLNLSIRLPLALNECAIPGYVDIVNGALNANYGSSGNTIISRVSISDTASLAFFSISSSYALSASYAPFSFNSSSFVTTSSFNGFTASISNTYFKQGGNSFGVTASLGTTDNFPLSLKANNTESIRIESDGQMRVPYPAPASGSFVNVGGYTYTKLGIKMPNANGLERVMAVTDVNNNTIFSIINNGNVTVGSGTAFISNQMRPGAGGYNFQGSKLGNYVGYEYAFFTGNAVTATTGVTEMFRLHNTSNQVSGTNTSITLSLTGSISQSIAASGSVVRGIYYNPNVINLVGDHIGLELTSGKTIIQGFQVALNANPKVNNYTASFNDYVIIADSTSGAVTVTLPTAVGCAGRTYIVKRINSGVNNVTIGTTASQTIDGSSTYVLAAQWKFVQVHSNGSNWLVTGNN